MVTRNRDGRKFIAIASPFATFVFGWFIGVVFAWFFKLPTMLGMSVGLGLGALGVMWLVPRLYVANDAVSAFVTVDFSG